MVLYPVPPAVSPLAIQIEAFQASLSLVIITSSGFTVGYSN